MKFLVYSRETKNGIDYQVGNRRSGALQVGHIYADTKLQAVAMLKNKVNALVGTVVMSNAKEH